MNGRLYDPLAGRFLSADNSIQDPTNTQHYNRYSYCLNNPLKYSDPSGMMVVPNNPAINAYFTGMQLAEFNYPESSGSGGGAPGIGQNGGGLNGYYYDWYTGTYRSTSRGNSEVSFWDVYYGAILPNAKQPYNNTHSEEATTGGVDASKGGSKLGSTEKDQGTINNLGGVNGLTLNSYYAYSPDGLRPDPNGGVLFDITYTTEEINSNAEWLQFIFTSCPTCGRTSPYFDNMDENCKSSGNMYYAGYQYTDGTTSGMYDAPSRRGSDGNVNWTGFATLWQDGYALVMRIKS